jgi:hypothetical protein
MRHTLDWWERRTKDLQSEEDDTMIVQCGARNISDVGVDEAVEENGVQAAPLV